MAFLGAFFIGAFLDYLLLFNLIFSYLWLVVVAFAASWFTYANSRQAHAVEAFSFIALYVKRENLKLLCIDISQFCPALQRHLQLASRLPWAACAQDDSGTGDSEGVDIPVVLLIARFVSIMSSYSLLFHAFGDGPAKRRACPTDSGGEW